MSYSLSFADRFLAHDDVEAIAPSERPVSVYQAIVSLREETWRELARNVFHVTPERLSPEAVLSKVIETDTCSNLDDPVEVWIDPDGYFTVFVHAAAAAEGH